MTDYIVNPIEKVSEFPKGLVIFKAEQFKNHPVEKKSVFSKTILSVDLTSRIELLVFFFQRQHEQQEQQVTAHQTAKHGVIRETLEGEGRQVRPL